MKASSWGHVKIVSMISNIPFVSMDEANNSGFTPLMAASRAGHVDVVTELLSHGANTQRVDVYGRKAIHYAAEWGRAGVVRRLLASPPSAVQAQLDSPSINDITSPFRERGGCSEDACNRSPLLLAAKKGHVGVIQSLLSRCGDGVNPMCFLHDEEGRAEVGDTFDGGLHAARCYCDARGYDGAIAAVRRLVGHAMAW